MFQRECVVMALCPTSCVQQIFIGQGQKDSPKLPNNTHPHDVQLNVEQRDLSPLIPRLNERKPNGINKCSASSRKINPHFRIKLFWEVATIVRLNLCV